MKSSKLEKWIMGISARWPRASTTTHLSLDCAYARVVWHLLAEWTRTNLLEVQRRQFAAPVDWWRSKLNSLFNDEMIVAIYGVWHIWKERCRRVFQNSAMLERPLLEMISSWS
jgi:hypothetical protein